MSASTFPGILISAEFGEKLEVRPNRGLLKGTACVAKRSEAVIRGGVYYDVIIRGRSGGGKMVHENEMKQKCRIKMRGITGSLCGARRANKAGPSSVAEPALVEIRGAAAHTNDTALTYFCATTFQI